MSRLERTGWALSGVVGALLTAPFVGMVWKSAAVVHQPLVGWAFVAGWGLAWILVAVEMARP